MKGINSSKGYFLEEEDEEVESVFVGLEGNQAESITELEKRNMWISEIRLLCKRKDILIK